MLNTVSDAIYHFVHLKYHCMLYVPKMHVVISNVYSSTVSLGVHYFSFNFSIS